MPTTAMHRRPRIAPDLAEKIDELRGDGLSFERYIEMVLERHAGFYLGDETTPHRKPIAGDTLHSYTDDRDGSFDIAKPLDSERDEYGALAILYMHDEEWENPASAILTEGELRAIRDLCTDLLGELSTSRGTLRSIK